MYVHQTGVGNSLHETKFVGPFTLVNIGAAGLLGFLASMFTNAIGLTGPNLSPLWWVQIVIIGGGALLGIMLTRRLDGLSLLDRLLLRGNCWMRRMTGDDMDGPDSAITTSGAHRAGGAVAIYRDGQRRAGAWLAPVEGDDI